MIYRDFVFDAMPGPDGCRFIEVEDHHKRSVRVGKWMTRDDGHIVLRVSFDVAELEAENERLQKQRRRLLVKLLRERVKSHRWHSAFWEDLDSKLTRRLERTAAWCRETADRIEGESQVM